MASYTNISESLCWLIRKSIVVDYHGNKMINYSEFLAATIDIRNFLAESRLKAVLNQFDGGTINYSAVKKELKILRAACRNRL